MNILCEMSLLQIRWDMSAAELHNFIRGNDKVPGAWAVIDNQVPHSTSVAVFFYVRLVFLHQGGAKKREHICLSLTFVHLWFML